MSTAEKAPYRSRRKQAKGEYKRELAAWEEENKDILMVLLDSVESEVPSPGPFFIYFKEHKASVMKEPRCQGFSSQQIMKELSRRFWAWIFSCSWAAIELKSRASSLVSSPPREGTDIRVARLPSASSREATCRFLSGLVR